jgi:hypothetical protein
MQCDPNIQADFRSNTFVTHIPTFLDNLGFYNARHSPSKNCYTELHSGVVSNNRKIWKRLTNKKEIIAQGFEELRNNGSYIFYSDLGNYLHDLGILTIQRGLVNKDRLYKVTFNIIGLGKVSYHFYNFDSNESIQSHLLCALESLIKNKTLS